jgi:hypothetical protein
VSGSDPVGRFLRRGLTIVSYNILESFISERLGELAEYINGGVVHFSDLPERLQRAASFDVVRFANSRIRRERMDLMTGLSFTGDIGLSLVANSGPLKLSSLMWQWEGSNMGAGDLGRALTLFHVASPWRTIEELSKRAGAHIADPEGTLIGFIRERNKCAHESSYEVSNLWIRAVPAQLQSIGMSADISMSLAAHQLHTGQQDFLRDDKWMSPNKVRYRFIQQRNKKWAELVEGSSRARRVSTDKDFLITGAVNSARSNSQVVVVQDRTLQVIDWIYPEVP